jgi:hypothetical protein
MDSGGGLHGSPPLALARSNWARGSRCSARAFGSPEGCTYSDRGPDQGFPSGSVRLVRNPETVPMPEGSQLRSGGETWGPVSPDNVHETGVSPGGRSDPPSRPPRWSRSSELEEGPGHGPDPRFLCPSGPLLGAIVTKSGRKGSA